MTNIVKKRAMLLVGPTGSGKSPIGNILEEKTNWAHLDFGHNLRLIEKEEKSFGLNPYETDFVRNLLKNHQLFPNDKISIVLKILQSFINDHINNDGIILNGMPRNVFQATNIANIMDITHLIYLNCAYETCIERVFQRKTGKTLDHSNRTDDTIDAIKKKLQIFEDETKPLIHFYKNSGAKIVTFAIDSNSNEENLVKSLLEPEFS